MFNNWERPGGRGPGMPGAGPEMHRIPGHRPPFYGPGSGPRPDGSMNMHGPPGRGHGPRHMGMRMDGMHNNMGPGPGGPMSGHWRGPGPGMRMMGPGPGPGGPGPGGRPPMMPGPGRVQMPRMGMSHGQPPEPVRMLFQLQSQAEAEAEPQTQMPPSSQPQNEDVKFRSLQDQALQWQATAPVRKVVETVQQQAASQEQWQNYQKQMQAYQQQYQQWYQTQEAALVNVKLEDLKEKKATCEKQLSDWKTQFDQWVDQHKKHPNKDQFDQYQNQWKNWQTQMESMVNSLDMQIKIKEGSLQKDPFKNATSSQPLGSVGDSVKPQGANTAVPSVGQGMMPPTGPGIGQGPPIAPSRPDLGEGPGGLGAGPRPTGSGMGPGPTEMNPSLKPSIPGSIPGPGPGPRLESEKKLNTGPGLPGPKGMMPGKDSFPFPFPDDFPFPGDIDNFSFPDMKKLDAMFSGGFKTDDFPFPFPDFPMAPGMMGSDFPLPEGLQPEDMTKDMDEFMKQMESELGKVSADFSKASRVDQSKQQALKPKEFQGPVDRERGPKGIDIDPALSRQRTGMGGGMPGMERSSRSSMDFDRSRTEQGYPGRDQGPHSMERRRQEIDRGLSGIEKGFPGMDRGPSRMEMGGPGMERGPRGIDRGPQARDRGPQIDQGHMGRDRGPMEMDRGPMGMDRDLPGVNRGLPGMERGSIGMDRGLPEMDRGLVRMDRDPPGMNRGSSGINRGPIGMERGLPEMDKGLRRSDRGQDRLDQGPPGMESGPPGMEHGLPDMGSDPARMKRGQQGVDSSPSVKGSSPCGVERGPPGIESGPPGEESEEPRSEKVRLGIGSILAGLKSGPSGMDSDQQGKKTGPPGKKKIDKRPPGTDSRLPGMDTTPPGMDNGPSGMDRGLGLGSILAGLKSGSSGMGNDQPEKKTGSSRMSRIDRGPSRRDSRPPGIDDGPPGMDSGPPGIDCGPPGMDSRLPGMDRGPPGMDSRPPGMDSGPPGLKRGLGLGSILAGLKSGPPVDSGPPGMDTSPPGVEMRPTGMDKRPPGVNIAPPVSGMGHSGMSRGPLRMDIRPPGMDSLPSNMGTLPLSLTRGPPGPPGVDVGPPGAEHDSLHSHPLGVKKPPPSFEDVGPPGEDNIPPAVPHYHLGTVQGPVGFGNASSVQEAFEEPAPPGMEPPSKPQEPPSKPQVSTQLPRDPAPPGMEETYPPGMEPEQETQPTAETELSNPPEEKLSEFEQRQNKPLFPPSAPSKGLTQHFYQVGQSIPITGMVKDSHGASSFVSSKQTLTPSPLAGYEALESVKAKKEEKKVKVEPKLEEKKKGKGKKGNMNMPATIKFGETKNLKDSDESAKKKESSKDEPSKDEKKESSATDSSKDESVKDTKVKKTEKEKSPPKEISKRVAMRSTLPFITDSTDDKSMMPSSIGELFKKNSNPSAFSKEGKTSNRSYRKAAEDEEEEDEASHSKKAYRKDRDTRGRDDSLRTAAPSPPKSYRSQDRRRNKSYSPDKRRRRSRSRSRSPDRRKRRRDSPPRKRNSYSPGKNHSPQRRKNSRSPSRGKSNRSPDRRDRRDDKYRDDRRDRYQKDSERRGDKPSTEAFDKLRELIYDTLVRQPEDKPKDSPHGDRRRPDEREHIEKSRSPYSMDRSRSPLRSRRENYYPEAERPRMQHPPPRRDYVRDPLRDESGSLPRDPPRDAPWPAQREPSRDFVRSTSQDRLGERARSPPVAEKSAPIVFEYSHAESTRPAYDIDKREPIGSLLSHAAVVDVLDYSHGQARIPQAKAVSGSSLLQERDSMLPSEFVASTERQHADGGDTNMQQQQQQLPPQPPHEPPPQPSPPQPPKQQNQQQPPQQQMPYQDQQLQQFPQQPSEQVYQYQSDDPTQFDPYNEQYQQLGSQMAFQMQQQQMQAFQQMGQYQDQYNTQQQEQFQQPPPPPPPEDLHSHRKSPPPPPPPAPAPAPPPPAPSKEDSFQQSWTEAPPPPPPSDPYANTRQGSSSQPQEWDTSRGRRGDSRQRERVDKYQSGSTRLVEDYRDSPGQKDMFTNSPQQTPPRPTKPKKREVVAVTDILDLPNREKRPAKICVVLRGPPGSGKSYIAKLIKDREIHNKGPSPRMLCLDDYFMSEKEKTEMDPETGKMVKKRFQEYEYEDSMESIYHVSLLKTFKKTIEDGFFDFIIVDAVNDKISKIEPFWTYAKMKGFEVYVAELLVELGLCIQRDIHNRGEAAIRKIIEHWEFAPRKYIKLDVVALLQDAAIPEVEMEEEEMDTGPSMEELMSQQHEALEELEDQEETLSLTKSKWDTATEDKLDALDGIRKYKKKDYQSMEDFLSGGDEFDFVSKPARPGQKTVRWADIEERQNQERMRALGFVVGQTATDWAKITDDNYADKALNRTKYI